MRVIDWSSDVCSSDLRRGAARRCARRLFGNPFDDLRLRSGTLAAGGAQHRSVAGVVVVARGGADLVVPNGRDGAALPIGRATCRAGGWPYVLISGVDVLLKTQSNQTYDKTDL